METVQIKTLRIGDEFTAMCGCRWKRIAGTDRTMHGNGSWLRVRKVASCDECRDEPGREDRFWETAYVKRDHLLDALIELFGGR